jgi:hypothetical protein
LSLGNINNSRRNKPDAKTIIGFIPIIKSEGRKNQYLREISLKVFHKCMEILLDPLIKQPKHGIYFNINNKIESCFMKLSVIIADWPEASTFCLTYKSSNGLRPCHTCTITRDKLNSLDISPNQFVL